MSQRDPGRSRENDQVRPGGSRGGNRGDR